MKIENVNYGSPSNKRQRSHLSMNGQGYDSHETGFQPGDLSSNIYAEPVDYSDTRFHQTQIKQYAEQNLKPNNDQTKPEMKSEQIESKPLRDNIINSLEQNNFLENPLINDKLEVPNKFTDTKLTKPNKDEKSNFENNDSASFELETRIEHQNPELVVEACSSLDGAVLCIDRCEAMLTTLNDQDCGKIWVSIICQLTSVKETLGKILKEISAESNLPSIKVETDLEPPDYEQDQVDRVKPELSDEDGFDDDNDDANEDTFNEDDLDESEEESDKDFHIPTSRLKTKKKRLGKERLGRPKKKFADSCDVCEETFKLKKDLLNHKKEFDHYGEDEGKTYCEKCDKTFIKKHSYKRHLERAHSKQHKCNTCDQALDSRKELREHMMNKHDKKLEKCLTCATCRETFNSVIFLHNHMIEANHINVTCEVCSKVFTSEDSLKIHVQNQHSQKFPCSECSETLDSKKELRKHMTALHAVPQEYVCQTCGHSTHSKGSFWRHVQIHGARKHKCEYCEKSFHIKHALTIHLRVHTGERPYVCQVCGTAFRKNSALNQHKIIHTGEKPYVCYLCNKGFTQKGNLKTHMKSHISGNLAPCVKE